MSDTTQIPELRGDVGVIEGLYHDGEISETEMYGQMMLAALHNTFRNYSRSSLDLNPLLSLERVNQEHPGILHPDNLAQPRNLSHGSIHQLMEGRNPILHVYETRMDKLQALIKHTNGLDLPPGLKTSISVTTYATLTRRVLRTAADEMHDIPPRIVEEQKQARLDSYIRRILAGEDGDQGYSDFVSFLPWAEQTFVQAVSEMFPADQVQRASRYILGIAGLGMQTGLNVSPKKLHGLREPILIDLGQKDLDSVKSKFSDIAAKPATRKLLSSEFDDDPE